MTGPWSYFVELAQECAEEGDVAGAMTALRRAVTACGQAQAPEQEEARVLLRLGVLLLRTGEGVEAGLHLERAHELLSRTLPAAHPERIQAALWLARQELADDLLEEAEATLLAALGDVQGRPQTVTLEVELLATLAEVYGSAGRAPLAVEALRRAQALESRGPASSAERMRELSFAMAAALSAAGQEEDADQVRLKLLADTDRSPRANEMLEAELTLWAAQREIAAGERELAERRLRAAVKDPAAASPLPLRRALAYLLADLERFDEAERELSACLAEASERDGVNASLPLLLSLDLAALRARLGQREQAENLLRALLERIQASPEELPWLRADALVALSALLINSPAERGSEAVPLLLEALGIQRMLGATDPHTTADTLLQLAIAKGDAGDEVEARGLAVRAATLLAARSRAVKP